MNLFLVINFVLFKNKFKSTALRSRRPIKNIKKQKTYIYTIY